MTSYPALPADPVSELTFTVKDVAQIRKDLRAATTHLSERGLFVSAKWASELLVALATDEEASRVLEMKQRREAEKREGDSMELDSMLDPHVPPSPAGPSKFDTPMSNMPRKNSLETTYENEEEDIWLLAQTYLDSQEYELCSATLKNCRSARAIFLRCYMGYLASERRLQAASGELMSLRDRSRTVPPQLFNLLDEVVAKQKDMEARAQPVDGFLMYLRGVLEQRVGRRQDAINSLILSVTHYPYNWSAWTKLCDVFDSAEELALNRPNLPPLRLSNPNSLLFNVHVTLEIHSASELLYPYLDALDDVFPRSLTVRALRALIAYHLREFETAEDIYSDVFEKDPYRLDDIDTYSNILYVMDKRHQLAELSARYALIDAQRPEVCCLVGNYFSLRGEHDKAMEYFQRALKLDRGYLSAWTLLGHEYVEMKNNHAAIEAYRRATEVNHKDYRAWFGLGQTYDSLGMHHHSLAYYQKSTALRPFDVRMWMALGTCYEKLSQQLEAIRCYKRALLSSEPGDTSVLIRIASVYEGMSQPSEAKWYHERVVELGVKEHTEEMHLAASRLFLCRYEIGPFGTLPLQERPSFLQEHLYQVVENCPGTEYQAQAQDLLQNSGLPMNRPSD